MTSRMCKNIRRLIDQNSYRSQKFEVFHDVETIKSQTSQMNRVFNRV